MDIITRIMICVIRVLLGAKLKNYNQIQIMIMLLIFILIETTIGMSCEYIIRLLFRNIVELMDESHRIPYMEQWEMNCKHNELFAFRIEECFDYKKRGNHWLLIKFRTNKDITSWDSDSDSNSCLYQRNCEISIFSLAGIRSVHRHFDSTISLLHIKKCKQMFKFAFSMQNIDISSSTIWNISISRQFRYVSNFNQPIWCNM